MKHKNYKLDAGILHDVVGWCESYTDTIEQNQQTTLKDLANI